MERFSDSQQLTSFAKKLSLPRGRFALCGLRASALSLFTSACVKKSTNSTHLFLFADKQRAVYFYNDLELIYGQNDLPQEEKSIVFYPASYTHQSDAASVENANVVLRNMALQKSMSGRAEIVVSYPQALCEKVMSSQKLGSKIIQIKKGDE